MSDGGYTRPATAPPRSSLEDWRVGAADGGRYEVRIVLSDAAEARAWAHWLLSCNALASRV